MTRKHLLHLHIASCHGKPRITRGVLEVGMSKPLLHLDHSCVVSQRVLDVAPIDVPWPWDPRPSALHPSQASAVPCR